MNGTDAQSYETRLLAEYKTLRDEALLRIRTRGQILTATLVVFGILMTLASHAQASNELALLYPVMAVFFAIRWAHTDVRIGEIGEYIRNNIENKQAGLGWETYIHDRKTKGIDSTSKFVTRPTEIAAIGIFSGSTIVSGCLCYFSRQDICSSGNSYIDRWRRYSWYYMGTAASNEISNVTTAISRPSWRNKPGLTGQVPL
jgi:hypothetical protein